MLIQALIDLFSLPLRGVAALLPTWAPPDLSAAVGSASGVWGYVGWANQYLPIAECLTIVGLGLTAFGAIQLVRFTVWVLTKLHVLGGSD